jgi:hypothetical protein
MGRSKKRCPEVDGQKVDFREGVHLFHICIAARLVPSAWILKSGLST